MYDDDRVSEWPDTPAVEERGPRSWSEVEQPGLVEYEWVHDKRRREREIPFEIVNSILADLDGQDDEALPGLN